MGPLTVQKYLKTVLLSANFSPSLVKGCTWGCSWNRWLRGQACSCSQRKPSGRCPGWETGHVWSVWKLSAECMHDFHGRPGRCSCGNSSACCHYPLGLWVQIAKVNPIFLFSFWMKECRRLLCYYLKIFIASPFRRFKHLHPVEGGLGHVTCFGPWNERTQVCPPSLLSLCHRPAQTHLGDDVGSLGTTAIK